MAPNLSKEAIIKVAQFLSGLTSHQETWVEIGRILLSAINADLVAFGETSDDGEMCLSYIALNENNTKPGCKYSAEDTGQSLYEEGELCSEIKNAISETLESGFLTTKNISAQVPLSIAFLPLSRGSRITMVMVIGYAMDQLLDKSLLNDLLAVAGLVEATVTRLATDKELKHYQKHLKDLVAERTNELNTTNKKLQEEIKQRIDAEKALQLNMDNLDRILESMEDYIYIVNNNYEVEYMNSAFKKAFQSDVKNSCKCFEVFNDKSEICSWCNMEQVLAGRSNRREWQSKRYANTYDVIETPLLNRDGSFSMLAIFRDITDRKNIERSLKRQASERAAVDAFTNSVSHDLQAPLRRIEGFSEALLEECPDELSDRARDYLERITRQIASMKVRTDALLKLSRVVSHGINNEAVNLSILARSYLEKLYHAEPDRLVETVIAPEMQARGDVKLLSVVLENLLHNAWKFTAEKERPCIECGSFLEDGRAVYFVKDNGVGFDQKYAGEIFDPFKKLHSETDYPGIGIGLNLVHRIISRHGGDIWAEGEVGKGACFYFTLP